MRPVDGIAARDNVLAVASRGSTGVTLAPGFSTSVAAGPTAGSSGMAARQRCPLPIDVFSAIPESPARIAWFRSILV